jgi:hypothetical protein
MTENDMTTPLPECYGLAGYTEKQVLEYGKAEFERALLLAMHATRAFGSTGDVIAVCIGNIKREDEK